MEHSDAEVKQAVERYVLGDLSVSEVEEFERHFFDCPQCSEELRILSMFQDNARAVFIERGLRSAPVEAATNASVSKSGRRGLPLLWWQRPWVMALCGLVIGVLAADFALPDFRNGSAQSLSSYPLYAASRGEETMVTPRVGAGFYTLYMDRTWDADFASYRAVVRDDPAGKDRFEVAVNSPAPGRAIEILVPGRKLPAGRYTLVMYGSSSGKETEVARYPFTIRFE